MDACEVSAEDVDLDYVNAGGVREREARAGVSVVSPVRVGTARAPVPGFPRAGATGTAGAGQRRVAGMWATSRGWTAIA